MGDAVLDELNDARQAFASREWRRAFDLLRAVDARAPLGPADSRMLAEAARWVREYKVLVSALEQAESRYEREGDRGGAARAALSLCREHFIHNNVSGAAGWLHRAARLLDGEPECPAHGYLQWTLGRAAWGNDEVGTALECARQASDIGRRLGDADLEALGLHDEGHILIAEGEIERGRALIDEAAVLSASANDRVVTGMVYCGAIWAYRNLADWRRAAEWTDAASRWCEREAVSGFPGLCRFHRAEVQRLRGHFEEAERDTLDAIEELEPANAIAAGWALNELGEIRRRRGDLAAARDAFRRAHEVGAMPQPGLGLLLLDEGKPRAALASIAEGLAQMVGVGREDRLAVLPAAVTIAIAAGGLDQARVFLSELETRAGLLQSAGAVAAASGARGELELAMGSIDSAIASLREACRCWCEIDAPFETARTRVFLGSAMRANGDASIAAVEFETALGTFERLGAAHEVQRVRSLLISTSRARIIRVLMFTDIVDSTKFVELLGDDAWGSLLDWHDRTLRRCFASADGQEVNHEGDGFFVAFGDPCRALDCAISIQRTLEQHRRKHGFAPQVRIGLHIAETVDLGDDYLGRGVHQAARVGAAAAPSEILATAAVLAAAGDHCKSVNQRPLNLKGLSAPLDVATVYWQ